MLTLPCNVTFLAFYLSACLIIQYYYYCKRHPTPPPPNPPIPFIIGISTCRCMKTSGQYFVEGVSGRSICGCRLRSDKCTCLSLQRSSEMPATYKYRPVGIYPRPLVLILPLRGLESSR
ncbi:hypothetical protein LY76DRAFT_129345 [Colletotrichum caudatum]|nr:hypothetical protein LY76DRAFT_129345 [Colletotrichum caudatum]